MTIVTSITLKEQKGKRTERSERESNRQQESIDKCDRWNIWNERGKFRIVDQIWGPKCSDHRLFGGQTPQIYLIYDHLHMWMNWNAFANEHHLEISIETIGWKSGYQSPQEMWMDIVGRIWIATWRFPPRITCLRPHRLSQSRHACPLLPAMKKFNSLLYLLCKLPPLLRS